MNVLTGPVNVPEGAFAGAVFCGILKNCEMSERQVEDGKTKDAQKSLVLMRQQYELFCNS